MLNAVLRGRRGRTQHRRLWPAIIVAAVIVIVGAAALLLSNHDQNAVISRTELASLWNSGQVEKTLAESRAAVEKSPFDEYFLTMRGISAYYSALNAQDEETRQQLLEESVVALRKAIAIGVPKRMKAQLFYILGKSYYQEGAPWFDLSERYLLLAKKSGSRENDISQYLAILYSAQNDYTGALPWFEQALKSNPSEPLLLSAAVTYRSTGQGEKASEILNQLSSSAKDAKIKLKANVLLSQMKFDAGDIAGALKGYQEALSEDPLNVDAWLGLGFIYSKQNNTLEARAAFRKVVQIDPTNADARKQLAGKL